MAIAGKVFRVVEPVDLANIAAKLKDFRVEEVYEHESGQYPLVTEVRDLMATPSSVEGVFAQDIAYTVYHREGPRIVIRTLEAPFMFAEHEGRLLLVVVEKKRRANNIANFFSKLLFIEVGRIVEARISPETLRRFHEANPEDTKVIFFDNVDIPNVEKLSLYGDDLINTQLYNEYLKHGTIWYIVFRSRRINAIVGLTRNAVVTVFTPIDPRDFLAYVRAEVFPLLD